MSLPSLAQGSLAATILAATYGAYRAFSPPNPSPKHTDQRAAASDFISRNGLASPAFAALALGPVAGLSLHAAALAWTYPFPPAALLGHGAANGLNPALTTWSPASALPLALILCAGVPLRLIAYASLGPDFTFALAKPRGLNTTGIYRYVQHPSYTGLCCLLLGIISYLGRLDGVLACWLPAGALRVLEAWKWVVAPCLAAPFFAVLSTRVREEEEMLKGEFGGEWEAWHRRTARFIPWVL